MRLSISLLAMCCALSAHNATPALSAETVGSWIIGPQTDPEIKAGCAMEMLGTSTTSILVIIHEEGEVRIGLRKRERFDLLPTEDPEIEISFDRKPAAWHPSSLVTPEVALTDAPDLAGAPDPLEISLRNSRTLDVHARGGGVSVVLSGTADAIDALRLCEGQADGVASKSQEPSPPNNLRNAMRGVAGTKPKIAEFRCELSGYALTGIVNPSGDARTVPITLSVAEDGSAFLNGATLAPAQVERAGGNDLAAIAYPFDAVYAALNGNADPFAVYGAVNPSEAAGLKAFGDVVKGMMSMAMGGRQRFMVVSLAQDSVIFFDLTPSGDTANRAAPDCVRTM